MLVVYARVVGILGSLGSVMGTDALRDLARLMRFLFPTDALWRAAADGAAKPLEGFGAGLVDPFARGGASEPAYLVFVVSWFAVVLGLAALSLTEREL